MDTDVLLFLAALPPLALLIWLRRRQRARIRRDPDHPLHNARPWPMRVQLALLAGYIAIVLLTAWVRYWN